MPTERREDGGVPLMLARESDVQEGIELRIDRATFDAARKQLDALEEHRQRAERESRNIYVR